MTYGQAIEFLYGLQQFGVKLGLENMRSLAELAGHPESGLRFIHVAGTNGKGSTCAMLESIYRTAGYRTGLYTSPHLIAFGERIQVNRQPLAEAQATNLVEEARSIITRFPGPHHPTFFEVVTLMALLHFRAAGCEVVVWETGLGGRCDATNIVQPLASAITHIAYDHQKWLGSTLAEIAGEKAGIIKPGVPVISDLQDAGAREVIENVAGRLGAPLRVLGQADLDRAAGMHPALSGEHQKHNAALACLTVETLGGDLPLKDGAVGRGLQTVQWPGRLQSIKTASGQQIVLDGAHNSDGARALARALRERFQGNLAMITGMLRDKDYAEMAMELAPLASRIYLAPVQSDRTADPAELAAPCAQANPKARVTIHPNLRAALQAAAPEELVVIWGSLYLIGEALEILGEGAEAQRQERGLNEWGQTNKS